MGNNYVNDDVYSDGHDSVYGHHYDWFEIKMSCHQLYFYLSNVSRIPVDFLLTVLLLKFPARN